MRIPDPGSPRRPLHGRGRGRPPYTVMWATWTALSCPQYFSPKLCSLALTRLDRAMTRYACIVQDIRRNAWNHHSSCDCCNLSVLICTTVGVKQKLLLLFVVVWQGKLTTWPFLTAYDGRYPRTTLLKQHIEGGARLLDLQRRCGL